MNRTSRIWRWAGISSAMSTLLLLAGFIYAVSDIANPSAEARLQGGSSTHTEKNVKAGAWDVTAIGDSLAKGTGDDTGRGFARRTVDLLNKEGETSKLVNNLGINGLTTEELLPMLEDPGVKYALQHAGIILLSIGGNDLFNGTDTLTAGEHVPTQAEIDAAIDESSKHFGEVVAQIKKINVQALLVYVSLYNPFSDLEGMREIGNDAVARWNAMAMNALGDYEGTLVVPTYDLFTQNSSRYLSSDHFHPNGDGYQAIAERMAQGIARE
ncbi:GDSL-type esterase/lipase family protein [Paenibacillus sp. MBLB2552]|uniref:GDSL-type esterase/lipase family protein n=1 Tax=Paenibacillus mellifer TaxID=2937794 RepID=A0A9X1XX65_9BACL|nr:GDSL-type esterase/lipase family protein [Paenibacillus mellifer]MCK8486974.1 GDSL-type esterase/lipase family protein [Paenibacillus mellifer]